MYQPYTDDNLEEKYHGQMDDTSDPQYAYEYGMRLYEIGRKYGLEDIDLVEIILYWLRRYIAQEETTSECVKQSRYIIAKLLNEYPELREEMKNK